MNNWYNKELREKYAILRKLLKYGNDEKIINTMNVIEACLSNECIPGDINILLEEDYLELTKTRFIWPYITKISQINNDFISDFSNDETILSKRDIIDLLYVFFKNGTTKEIYELFCKIYRENKKNIHFVNNNDMSCSGEIIYLEYFRKTYIQVFKSYSFEDLNTFAHEFGHAIQFNINFHHNLYGKLNTYIEIISIFFELICNEYFVNSEFRKPAIITNYSTLDEHLENAKNLNNELILLNAIPSSKDKLRKNIDILIDCLSKNDIDSIMYLRPSTDYIYVFAFLVATNLFMIYQIDRDKAFI